MKRQIIRLTEDDLHQIIENSVKRILKEEESTKEKENNESWKEFDNKKLKKDENSTAGFDDKNKNPKWTKRELAMAKYHKKNWINHKGDEKDFEFDYPKK